MEPQHINAYRYLAVDIACDLGDADSPGRACSEADLETIRPGYRQMKFGLSGCPALSRARYAVATGDPGAAAAVRDAFVDVERNATAAPMDCIRALRDDRARRARMRGEQRCRERRDASRSVRTPARSRLGRGNRHGGAAAIAIMIAQAKTVDSINPATGAKLESFALHTQAEVLTTRSSTGRSRLSAPGRPGALPSAAL